MDLIDIFDVKDEVEGFLVSYQRSLARLKACVDGLNPEQLNWRPSAAADTNSIAVLAVHTMGNIHQNVIGVACGLPDDRDRDAEFVSRSDDPGELIRRANDLYAEIESALAEFPAEKLDDRLEHPHRGPTTRRQALLVAARHSSEHVGQMELTRDMVLQRLPSNAVVLRQIHHAAITVPTSGLQQAKDFYGGVLGLTEAERPDADLGRPGAWYALGETEVHIQCRDETPGADTDYHPAFIVGDVAALKAALSSKGVEVEDAPTLMGRERFFCRDPFGNRLEFMTLPDSSGAG